MILNTFRHRGWHVRAVHPGLLCPVAEGRSSLMFRQVKPTNNAKWWAFLETVSRQGEKVDKSSMKGTVWFKKSRKMLASCSIFGVTMSLLGLKKPQGVFPPSSRSAARPQKMLHVRWLISVVRRESCRWLKPFTWLRRFQGDGAMEGGKFRTLLLLLLQ